MSLLFFFFLGGLIFFFPPNPGRIFLFFLFNWGAWFFAGWALRGRVKEGVLLALGVEGFLLFRFLGQRYEVSLFLSLLTTLLVNKILP